ncbi:MAG: hypothetical protein GY792_10880, partial [Gammaproteobacteria bacterium]|nr:hypothetical protein [Gammaproteobacteria bacterium]
SDNNVIAGNYIGTDVTGTTDSGNGGDGVQLTNGSSDNTIGGSIDGAGNLISGNDGNGITVSGATTTGNIIQGNLIGTDATGTSKLRNESNGINLDSSFSTTIGGTGTFERNVISGHDSLWADGIYISGGGSHTIQGNYIGLGSDGVTALGNYTNGVAISGSNNNLIGGTATGAGNVIAHNGYNGISIDELAGTGNSILGNSIYSHGYLGIDLISGTDIHTSFESAGNQEEVKSTLNVGQTFSYSSGNGTYTVNQLSLQLKETSAASQTITVTLRDSWNGTILGTDTIASTSLTSSLEWYDFDFGDVALTDGNTYTIRVTSDTTGGKVFVGTNAGGGYGSGTQIDKDGNAVPAKDILFRVSDSSDVTYNDANDADTGANNLQNFPVITAAATAGSQIEISGTLDTDGLNKDYRIEFFATGTPDALGYGEAERYLGYTTVTTDGSGDASFTATIAALVYADEEITATATVDNGGGSYGDTSEFAQNFTVTAATNTTPTFMPLGSDGIVTTPIGSGDDGGNSTYVQSDGKILVAGYTHNGSDLDFALTRYNTDGSLDTSFGTGGIVTQDFGYGDDLAQSVIVQSDDKIVVAGYADSSTDKDFAVVRYNSDGSLDMSFNGGLVTTDIGNDDRAFDIALQADGKILVAGERTTDIGHTLVRYDTNGNIDTTFADDGIFSEHTGWDWQEGYSVVVQSDGKILFGGLSGGPAFFKVSRLNSDGTYDTTFDGDGKVFHALGGNSSIGKGISLQSDGKILQVGYHSTTEDVYLFRYNSDGSLDTSFDGDGKVTTDIGGGGRAFGAPVVQVDGKILVAAYGAGGGVDNDVIVLRYNTNGSLDTTFGINGKATTDLGNEDDIALELKLQTDGKILVVGTSFNSSNDDIVLLRYNTNGSLDTSFDSNTTLDGTPSFTEGGAAVVLDSNVEIRDAELDALNSGNGNYDGASVTLARNGGANTEDVFSATGTLAALTESGNLVVGATTIGTVTTNSGGTLVLTFNSSATTALVNSAMQQIAYSNSSDDPPA